MARLSHTKVSKENKKAYMSLVEPRPCKCDVY